MGGSADLESDYGLKSRQVCALFSERDGDLWERRRVIGCFYTSSALD